MTVHINDLYCGFRFLIQNFPHTHRGIMCFTTKTENG